jgi:hypothetical protein
MGVEPPDPGAIARAGWPRIVADLVASNAAESGYSYYHQPDDSSARHPTQTRRTQPKFALK